MTSENFVDKVVNFTQERSLIPSYSSVIVGVSGGADSMALLHILCSNAFQDITVHAVHIHHGLRGDEADSDERLVTEYCKLHHIPLHIEHADINTYATQWNCGVEEAGRRVRYDTFERLRIQHNADIIATAHTADDNCETTLMHILRGCGISGLSGIPAKRGHIIRPLLSCNREEIEAYCAEQTIPYCLDSTNTDTTFTRNRIRHDLIPLMQEINPAIKSALLRLTAAAAQDEAYFVSIAEQLLQEATVRDNVYRREVFLRQPMPIFVRLCRMLFAKYHSFSFTETHIEALHTAVINNRGLVYLPNNCCISVSGGLIMPYTQPTDTTVHFVIDTLPFSFTLNGTTYHLEVISHEQLSVFENVHKKFFKLHVDYDKIQGDLYIRCRQEGDAIHFQKRNIGKSIKKLFQECHIPVHMRDTIPLLCDNAGIVSVFGIGCDQRVCPDDSTNHFLVWTADNELSYDE